MRGFFKYIREDALLLRLFVLTFILIAVTVFYIIFNYRNLPPLLPVFNQLPWGEKRLSTTPGIFLPILIVLIIFLINFFSAGVIYQRTPLISRMFAVTSFLIALLTLLFILRTVQLVI